MVHGIAAPAAVPRGLLIADAWSRLGEAVAPLSNASGRPLARTVKLILDPLLLRPAQNPRFSGGVVDVAHVDDLRRAILDAGPLLAATAAWFGLLKQARRRAGITEGHPQDLYFQRCFALAHLHGDPGPDAAGVAAAAVAEVHAERGAVTADRLRRFLTDPARAAELTGMLRDAWASRAPTAAAAPHPGLKAFLEDCAVAPDPRLWRALADEAVGSAEAAGLEAAGAARRLGLSDRDRPARPELGERASKRTLPPPLDRSIMERLFAALTAWHHRESMADIPQLVTGEIRRSAGPWQLGREEGRVLMALGRDAGRFDAPTASDANARLSQRWSREKYVGHLLGLPDPEAPEIPAELLRDVRDPHGPFMRRLWARVHGRELRSEPVGADEAWDLLDGALRSVIMDQRDRLRRVLDRAGATP